MNDECRFLTPHQSILGGPGKPHLYFLSLTQARTGSTLEKYDVRSCY